MIDTKKNEIKFVTSDPEKMLNRFLSKDVIKAWKEAFVDESTGELVDIERNEKLFKKGQFINQDLLMSIKFSMGADNIKEVEVSNQNRKGFEYENNCLYPYLSQIRVGTKKHKILFHATDISCAELIIKDFAELTFDGGFEILLLKKFDYVIILNDVFSKKKKEDEEGEDDEKEEKKFYQIQTKITYDEGSEQSGSFVINTVNIDRGMLVIQDYLAKHEEEQYQNALKHDGDYKKREFSVMIEEAKQIPINYFIPRDFSMAYVSKQ